MNRLMIATALAAVPMFPALAQDKPARVAPGCSGDDPEALKLVSDCNARKFETVVEREENGGAGRAPRSNFAASRARPTPNGRATLKDAAREDRGERRHAAVPAKDQLSAALKAEIAKV